MPANLGPITRSSSPASPSGTLYTGVGATIVDAAGNDWYIQNGQIVENGVVDTGTNHVIAEAYVNGVIWQENTSKLWWAKTNAPGAYDGWSPNGGTLKNPVPTSPDGTILATGDLTGAGTAASAIVDGKGNTWTIQNGKVVESGVVDNGTANVIELALKGGVIWQENASDLWWSKTNGPNAYDGWTQGLAPVPVPMTWVPGGGNLASSPTNWSAHRAPIAGDTLTMVSGTMNLTGSALAGDPLNVGVQGGTDVAVINVTGAAAITERTAAYGSISVTVNLAANSRLTGGFSTGPGNSLLIQGLGSFANTATSIDSLAVINANVVGVGSFNVYSAHSVAKLEFMHGVAATQSVAVSGYESYGQEYGTVQVDDPHNFHAAISLGFGDIIMQGLKADSYTLKSGLLSLYSGKSVVDAVALTMQTTNFTPVGFGVSQTATGISIHGNGAAYADGGTLLPLHTA